MILLLYPDITLKLWNEYKNNLLFFKILDLQVVN